MSILVLVSVNEFKFNRFYSFEISIAAVNSNFDYNFSDQFLIFLILLSIQIIDIDRFLVLRVNLITFMILQY